MTDTRHRYPSDDEDPIESAHDRLQRSPQEPLGAGTDDGDLDGQLGPDEISEPDEVIKNNNAKAHD